MCPLEPTVLDANGPTEDHNKVYISLKDVICK